MNKKKFYIYQEDLIRYMVSQEPWTISQLVEDLNKRYSQEDMQKLRTDTITNYLHAKGYLTVDDKNRKRPTQKGSEYYGAAEPLVRCGESHLSGLTEPLRSLV